MKRKALLALVALVGLVAAIIPLAVWRFRSHREAAI